MAVKNSAAALAAKLASKQTQNTRLESLRDLLGLTAVPQRVECFDISHTMGEATVASCVVFGPEGPEKSQYRRFNITGITGGDDYAAMHQALERRYRRVQKEEGRLPDILLIDGGPGQVRQAIDVLRELGIDGVQVVGVAKGESRRSGHESLILGDSGRTLWPGPESPASHLIQSVRDEAHRFAITGHRARFLDLARRNAEAALASRLASRQTLLARFEALRDLLGLDETPQRIECFDISHTMGEATVASCVVFGPEGPEKSQYRRFNINGITPGDDYAAMRQALQRRFRRDQVALAPDSAADAPAKAASVAKPPLMARLPDLLLIDGGKGQLQQALDVLNELGIEGVPIVGVAKGEARRAGDETLIVGHSGRTLFPGPESPASHLVQAVRDEAHRFAITGHRGRREKAREASTLEEIAGVGARRRSALLKHFGGLGGLSRAGIEELMQVNGISRQLAERIYATFHG
jgi:excinuclease UvrABC nuclease subunit